MRYTDVMEDEVSPIDNKTQIKLQGTVTSRLGAMDIQRGIIMMLMAFSHCREYIGIEHYSNINYTSSPAWLGSSWLDLLQQIIVSTVAANGFFMMMGIGIVFLYQSRLKDGWSMESTCSYLIKRGMLLAFIQLTLLQAFEIISTQSVFFYGGVLLSLGCDMILASMLLYIIYKLKYIRVFKACYGEYLLPILFIIAIIVTAQSLFNQYQNKTIQPIWIIALLFEGNFHYGINFDINFTPIPWFPAVLFGLIIGQLLCSFRDKSFKILLSISLFLLFAWVVLRTANLQGWTDFGDYKRMHQGDSISLASYFSVCKHPPSIAYFLWGLGINLLCIAVWQLIDKYLPDIIRLINPVKVFGQCALFFFIMHWFVYYGISLCLPSLVDAPSDIIVLWLFGLLILFWMCKRYRDFKSTKAKSSIWRMF